MECTLPIRDTIYNSLSRSNSSIEEEDFLQFLNQLDISDFDGVKIIVSEPCLESLIEKYNKLSCISKEMVRQQLLDCLASNLNIFFKYDNEQWLELNIHISKNLGIGPAWRKDFEEVLNSLGHRNLKDQDNEYIQKVGVLSTLLACGENENPNFEMIGKLFREFSFTLASIVPFDKQIFLLLAKAVRINPKVEQEERFYEYMKEVENVPIEKMLKIINKILTAKKVVVNREGSNETEGKWSLVQRATIYKAFEEEYTEVFKSLTKRLLDQQTITREELTHFIVFISLIPKDIVLQNDTQVETILSKSKRSSLYNTNYSLSLLNHDDWQNILHFAQSINASHKNISQHCHLFLYEELENYIRDCQSFDKLQLLLNDINTTVIGKEIPQLIKIKLLNVVYAAYHVSFAELQITNPSIYINNELKAFKALSELVSTDSVITEKDYPEDECWEKVAREDNFESLLMLLSPVSKISLLAVARYYPILFSGGDIFGPLKEKGFSLNDIIKHDEAQTKKNPLLSYWLIGKVLENSVHVLENSKGKIDHREQAASSKALLELLKIKVHGKFPYYNRLIECASEISRSFEDNLPLRIIKGLSNHVQKLNLALRLITHYTCHQRNTDESLHFLSPKNLLQRILNVGKTAMFDRNTYMNFPLKYAKNMEAFADELIASGKILVEKGASTQDPFTKIFFSELLSIFQSREMIKNPERVRQLFEELKKLEIDSLFLLNHRKFILQLVERVLKYSEENLGLFTNNGSIINQVIEVCGIYTVDFGKMLEKVIEKRKSKNFLFYQKMLKIILHYYIYRKNNADNIVNTQLISKLYEKISHYCGVTKYDDITENLKSNYLGLDLTLEVFPATHPLSELLIILTVKRIAKLKVLNLVHLRQILNLFKVYNFSPSLIEDLFKVNFVDFSKIKCRLNVKEAFESVQDDSEKMITYYYLKNIHFLMLDVLKKYDIPSYGLFYDQFLQELVKIVVSYIEKYSVQIKPSQSVAKQYETIKEHLKTCENAVQKQIVNWRVRLLLNNLA